MIYVDLHVHTNYSFDSTIPPKTIVERLYMHPFIKAVAITDHNRVEGYYKVKQLASAYPDILIIPGVEITTFEGDLILLGVAELPPKECTVANVIDFARENNGLAVAAHPYRAHGLGDLTKKYDVNAIEILNGVSPSHVNHMAEKLAKQLRLPGVAGSDAHHVDELWSVYNEVQASSDVDEILKAIKRGFVRAVPTGKSIHF
ncbi:MAG: CehA/McbA family metallohydrolase [Candidatus Bathyarchaeia archaeon]